MVTALVYVWLAVVFEINSTSNCNIATYRLQKMRYKPVTVNVCIIAVANPQDIIASG